jgi:hypothetical protein
MRRRTMPVLVALLAAIAVAGVARGQSHDTHAHTAMPAANGETRQLVAMPAPMVEHMLSNMRDHLAALHEIQESLARGDTDVAAGIAEARLGMAAMAQHGAEHMAPMMPPAMRDVGGAMHRAASRLSLAAKDAGVSGDVRPALAALAAVTGACVSCHAGFRVR